jgi:hypothetical protein
VQRRFHERRRKAGSKGSAGPRHKFRFFRIENRIDRGSPSPRGSSRDSC